MKRWPWLLIGLVIGALAVSLVRCPDSAELAKWKSDYAALKAQYEPLIAASQEHIAVLQAANAAIQADIVKADALAAAKDAEVKALKGRIKDADATVAQLRTEVQPALDANPALREFVASLDTAIVLRDNLIVEQDTLIGALKDRIALDDVRYANQAAIIAEWKATYEREHALLQSCEMGLALYDKQSRRLAFGRKLQTAAIVALGGLAVYSAVK